MQAFRSAVTNGRLLSKDIDLRSTRARRLRDLLAAHTADMGGEANISEAQKMCTRRVCCMELQLELLEHTWASREDYAASHQEMQLYQRVANSVRRLLETLSPGLRRRPRDIGPKSLDEYLANRQAAE
jgi:hypothetical protein